MAVSRAFMAGVITNRDDPDDVYGLVEVLDPSFEDGHATLSLVIRPDLIATPIAVDGTLAFLERFFAFHPAVDRLQLEVLAGNDRLVAGLRRLAHHEGTLRDYTRINGVRHDVELYALWASDLDRLRQLASGNSQSSVGSLLCEIGYDESRWEDVPVTELDSLTLLEVVAKLDDAAGYELTLESVFHDGAVLGDLVRWAEQLNS